MATSLKVLQIFYLKGVSAKLWRLGNSVKATYQQAGTICIWFLFKSTKT